MRRAVVLTALALLVACSQSSQAPPQASRAVHLFGFLTSAPYEIFVPGDWNGTLFLFSRGYVPPGGTNLAETAPSDAERNWLIEQHFAIAGSGYSSTGWALEDAFNDQIALLDFFAQRVGKPKRVIAWGVSLGGIITAGLVQLHPDRFAGALPMCGVMSGGLAAWNAELDGAYAFKTLLAPHSGLQLVHITDGAANLQLAESVFDSATQTPRGRARLALVAALLDVPGWFDPTRPEPAATDYASRLAAQENWESLEDFPYAFEYRQELESRAGGNPTWNVGVDYLQQLSLSPVRDEVTALYQQAGLDLGADISALTVGATISPDAAAAQYLARYITFDGRIAVPVLTLHTTGDGLTVPEGETAYQQVVSSAGRSGLLRQVFVNRAGHCAFTEAEMITAIEVLLKRIDTGRWDDAALAPAALDAAASRLGAGPNSAFGFSLSPSFVSYQPDQFLCPFVAGETIPS